MLKVPVTAVDHMQGDPNAPAILVEYGDYQCPHCAHAHPVVQRLRGHFGSRLAFVFRNFPLNQIHPEAETAAEAAEFAATHDRFWQMHDGIFENQANLNIPLLIELGESIGLPKPELQQALADQEFLPRVKDDFMGGVRSGVNGTPTFFINGNRHDGSFEFEELVTAIEVNLKT